MVSSSARNRQPVVLLVFANERADRARYLRNLGKECEQLEELLRPLEESGLIELDVLHNATAETLAARLSEYDGRTAILHYGGHASSLALFLEDEIGQAVEVSGEDLAAILSLQQELKLVFLNGCLTDGHIELLLDAGIPAVIGTTAAVPDTTALTFADEFYSQLAKGYTIARAYQSAAAATRLQRGKVQGSYHTVDGQIILDNPVGAPWVLQYRPGAEQVANWNIPAAAGNYLFNLPPLPEHPLPANPYHEVLAWYGAGEAEIFFGRGRQIRDLYLRLTASAGSPIILLCGQSGVGKSSLLEAGLLPRLEQTCAVCYRRRQREQGAAGTLRAALGAATDADGRALAALWRLQEDVRGRPLVILLDQVEEIFTRPLLEQPDELIELAQTVEEIFSASQPQGKLLLSFRKEYLPEIEASLQQRHVNSSYVLLARLDAEGIVEVITGPTSSSPLRDKYNLSIDTGLPEQIAANLSADAASPIATLLQILLAEMWEAARQAEPTAPRFDRELYYKLQRTSLHLHDFLAQRRAEYARQLPQVEESGLLLDILYFCTNEQGTAEQRSAQEFERRYGSDRDLTRILQAAKDLRLLVDAAGEAQAHSAAGGARLAHDTLAPVVRETFHRSTLPGQLAELVLLAHAANWTAGPQSPSAGQKAILDEADLNTVEKGLAGMRRPDPAEVALIADSRAERAAAQRRRMLSRLGIATVATIILALAVATGWFGWSAQESAAAARRQEAAALDSAAQSAAQLTLSQSREVAAVAENQLRNGDPQTALLLSLQAFTQITKTAQAETVLRQSLSQWQGLYTLAGHTDAVNGLFFSQDGRYLASASIDDTARLWDLTSGQPVLTIDAHAGDVSAALISGDVATGRHLITASRDGSTRIWSLPGGKLQHEIFIPGIADGIRSLSLHAAGEWIGLRAGNQIWLYDAATGQPVAASPYGVEGDQPVAMRSLAFTADGNQILAGGDDTLPHIWDIASGAHAALSPPEGIAGHQSAVLNFQQTRDQRFFVAVSTDRVALWERAPDTGSLAWRALLDSSGGVRFTGQALFSPDSRFLVAATASGSLRIWSLADLTAPPVQVNEYTTAVSGIWFSPDGRLLASAGGDGSLHMYDMVSRTSTSVAQMPGSTSAPVFSRDGSMLAAADARGTIHVWRTWLGGDQPALRLHAFAANAVALAGTQAVIAGSGGAVEFRNLADGSVRTQRIGDAYYTAAAASADGKLAAVADFTGLVAVLDVQSGRMLSYWRAEQQPIDDLQFLPNSDLLAVAGAMPAVHVWNWRTEELVAALDGPTNDTTSLVYAPASDRLYAAGRDGLIYAWQLPDLTPLPPRTAGMPLVDLAVSSDATQMVAAAANGPLFWWPTAAAASPRRLAVRSPVRSLAYTATGRLLAGTENGELQLWDLSNRSIVAVAAHGGRWVKDIAVASAIDGSSDIAGARAITIGDDGWLKQWLLEDEALVQLACNRAGRMLTTSEWDQYFDFGTELNSAPCTGANLAQGQGKAASQVGGLTFTEPVTMPTNYRPAVLYFESVQGSHVPLNSEVILRWSVVGGTQQDLEYQGFDAALRDRDELRIVIGETTTFRLIARNPYGVQILNLTVTPDG